MEMLLLCLVPFPVMFNDASASGNLLLSPGDLMEASAYLPFRGDVLDPFPS